MSPRALALGAAVFALGGSAAADPPTTRHFARGLTGEITLEYDGPGLRAKPDQDLNAAIVLRLNELTREPGGHRRYRLEFIGGVAGAFDLRELIEHADGTAASDLAPIQVTIESELPAQHGTDLFDLGGERVGLESHYRLLLGLVAAAWILVPVAVVVRRRMLRRPAPLPPAAVPAPTVADQLRPLVEAAMGRGLSIGEQARLELLLLSFWRERLQLGDLPPHEAIARLRGDGDAGRLLLAVERWLHARGEAGPRPAEDVAALLEPYRSMAALAEERSPAEVRS